MKGFTLIELLIVLGILVMTSALAIPFIETFQVSSDLQTDTNTLLQTLRRAQFQAIAGQNDSAWGVYFNNGQKKFTLYKGQNFATRDQSYDQDFSYPSIFNISSDFGPAIYFSSHVGQPSTGGMITFTSPNNQSKHISISSAGLIQNND